MLKNLWLQWEVLVSHSIQSFKSQKQLSNIWILEALTHSVLERLIQTSLDSVQFFIGVQTGGVESEL
ncbi:hypothetical protein ILYODFUR_029474 [Ilyodon furcidens]|uniref:Maturase K n=1 Tax=Ilyodon furcidens TaxID=33524 RepID=A0ABV0TCB8_9TELE